MAEIVNLRRARKAKGRAEKDRAADANRAKFGTPKSLRAQNLAEAEKAARDVEGHKLDSDDAQ
ncbi:MAG TPA: DUF4169 family protein [Rhizomicrobium sp.]|nr:DUF4169 family protein [Rhizomicrobium sp.]